MPNQDNSLQAKKENQASAAPLPTVGEPLDGRHFLDVTEEQQYSGKPFVKDEQNIALGQGGDAAARPELPKKG